MPRYRLSIAYDGTDFVGWQRQAAPNVPGIAHESLASCHDAPESSRERRAEASERAEEHDSSQSSGVVARDEVVAQGTTAAEELRSVQGVLERAVREAVRQPVTIIGASRTDSGVHARAQTAAFTTVERFTEATADKPARRIGPPDERLREAINSRLPPDVLVTRCVRTTDDFDPIAGCLCKGYEYTIHESEHRPLWERGRVWHQRGPLDVAAMDAAARRLEGTHDFAAFAAAGHGRESTVRTILSCRVAEESAGVRAATDGPGEGTRRLVIRVSADGFLWNMVRIIAGTLAEVGRGRMGPEDVSSALASRDRTKAGPTAPAHGLCLAWGMYEGDAVPAGAAVDASWLAARAQSVRARRAAWAERRASAGPEGGEGT